MRPHHHRVLKYFVLLRPDLPSGTTIPNRAAIYFDYNAAVGTNTVISTITGPLGVDVGSAAAGIAIIPNPSTGVLRIEGQLRPGGTIAVMDLLGNRLMTAPVAAPAAQTLDLRGLAAGTYLISMPAPAGTIMRQVVLVR